MPRKVNLDRLTDRQRKRSGKFRESLRARGIPFVPKRAKR